MSKTLLQKSFDSILEATKNSKGDVSQIFKKFKKNQPLRFTTGWSEHAVDVIIVEDLLLICNRGDERKKPSIKAYRIDRNQSTMTEKDFETLQERNITNDQNMIEFIYDTLPSKLSKKPPDHLIKFINKTCRQKSQKIGNCWWVNPMAGIFACLLMEKLIPLDKKFETEKEKTKAFQAAFDEVQPIFKQFSEFARVEVAKEYMLRKPDEIGRDHQLIRRIVNKLDSKKWKHLFEENNIGKLPPLFKKTEFTSIVDNYKNAFNLDEDFNPISAA